MTHFIRCRHDSDENGNLATRALSGYEIARKAIGTLRSDDGDGNGNATKAIGLISKTTILHVHHAFLYISLLSLHDYDVKMSNFTSYRGSTQATTKFLSPSELGYGS